MSRVRTLFAVVVAVGCCAIGAAVGPASASNSLPEHRSTGVVTQRLTTAQSPFTDRVLNQGWWAKGSDTQNKNDNYIVGTCCGLKIEYRDFFTFDLSAIRDRVLSAELRVNSGDIRGQALEQLGLFDVSTPAELVNNNRGLNAEIFRDLGTGTSYGTFTIAKSQRQELLTLTLNRSAILDINDARGGFFTVGGRHLSLSGDRRNEYIFGATQHHAARALITTAPVPAQ